jgi:outer membrane protein TolC
MELPGAYISHPNAGTNGAPGAVERVDLTQWWRSLRNPQLVSLVGRAIVSNPDIAIAVLRLQQARAQELVATGAALPNGGLGAGAGFGTGTDNTRGRVSEPLHSAGNTTGFSHVDEAGGFDMAWELDVFGK